MENDPELQSKAKYLGTISKDFVSVSDTLKEASYQLNVSDGVCVVAWTKTIDVAFDISNCEPLSFSPNGDGLEDEFYINQSGYAKVYDKKGKLVNEFAVPSYWDGRSKDGRLLDFGYYLVVINDQEKFGLSIMK